MFNEVFNMKAQVMCWWRWFWSLLKDFVQQKMLFREFCVYTLGQFFWFFFALTFVCHELTLPWQLKISWGRICLKTYTTIFIIIIIIIISYSNFIITSAVMERRTKSRRQEMKMLNCFKPSDMLPVIPHDLWPRAMVCIVYIGKHLWSRGKFWARQCFSSIFLKPFNKSMLWQTTIAVYCWLRLKNDEDHF